MAFQKFAVFVTYNSVGRNLPNGWHHQSSQNGSQNHDRSAYVVQGFLRKDKSSPDLREKAIVLEKVWQEMLAALRTKGLRLSQADYLVINCGKCPGLTAGLVGSAVGPRLIFVHCGCGGQIESLQKEVLDAGFVYAACGGIETMQRIFESYLSKGGLDCFTTVQEMLRPRGV